MPLFPRLQRERAIRERVMPMQSHSAVDRKRIMSLLEFPVAVAKALGAITAMLIATLVLVSLLRDELKYSTVKVTVSAASAEFLKVHHPGFEVPMEFISKLNGLLNSASSFHQNPVIEAAIVQGDNLSLKPFGLDTTSSQISGIARQLLGVRSPQLTIEVGCRVPGCAKEPPDSKVTHYFVSAGVSYDAKTKSKQSQVYRMSDSFVVLEFGPSIVQDAIIDFQRSTLVL